MQTKYGLYCIAPKRLREEGILLENIITYANKGQLGHGKTPAATVGEGGPHAPTPRATR